MPSMLDFATLGPAIALAITGLIVLLLGLYLTGEKSGWLVVVGLAGVVVSLILSLGQWNSSLSGFEGMVVADSLAAFFTTVALIVTALTLLLSANFVVREQFGAGEYYALVLFTATGMVVLANATDLIVFIIGLEILSIALYVLAGFAKSRATSLEAAMKYFLLGAFALGFVVYGSALICGATGTTQFAEIAAAIAGQNANTPLLLVGVGLLIVGFGFKLSFVPFHMWTPDVYEGAPSSVTGFMAVGTKAAVFGGLLRVLTEAFPALSVEWSAVFWALAIVTMLLGNVSALTQTNVKRMLAYSSIGQAGYILVAVASLAYAPQAGRDAVMFYVLAYTFMTIGAFAVVVALSGAGDQRTNIDDLDGLGRRNPLLAAAMAIFMLSLAGIPPTAGFMAKLYVFNAAVQAGYLDLAVIGVLTSAIATYYYLRVIVAMYMRGAEGEQPVLPVSVPVPLIALVAITILVTIQLGIFPVLPGDMGSSPLALVPGLR